MLRITIVSIVLVLFTCGRIAQAQDAAYANMQRAVGGILQHAAQSRGYSTTDPRTYGMLYGVGKAAVTTAAGVGTGALIAGTAPAWGTLLAATAVAAGVTWALDVTLDGVVKWAFGPDANTPITSQVSTTAPSNYSVWGPIDGSACSNSFAWNYCDPNGSDITVCLTPGGANPTLPCTWSGSGISTLQQAMDYSGYKALGGTPQTTTTPNQSIDHAISMMTDSMKQQKLSYEAMAVLVNELWRKAAAEEGYAGVPYQVMQPVTATEIQAWAEANSASYPTVSAITAPVSAPSVDFAPSTTTSPSAVPSPAISPTPTGAINPGASQPVVNLGPDPSIGAPSLEGAPTAEMILSPLLNLFPSLRNYVVPAHDSQCPTASFEVFGTAYTVDGHCSMAETIRPTLYAVMAAVWVMVGLFIVLAA